MRRITIFPHKVRDEANTTSVPDDPRFLEEPDKAAGECPQLVHQRILGTTAPSRPRNAAAHAGQSGKRLMKTLSDAEYAELLQRGTTCASCLNYQRRWDAPRPCDFWNDNLDETWGEAKVRAKTRPICPKFRTTDWRLSHPLRSSRGKGK